MKPLFLKLILLTSVLLVSFTPNSQEFQGQAFYFSKSKMELGSWGARMSEAQKKQIQARLKNRLEKRYVLNFNKEKSIFLEEDKLDAISGATDSWGKNFTQGDQYKNIKENALVQSQEFYGKQFLVKDQLQVIKWKMGKESKQIGQYLCFKATALIPTKELTWFNFSWADLRSSSTKKTDSLAVKSAEPAIEMTAVEAWYTPKIPVSHGPGEYWGLPGLILEVSAGNTTLLCSKIVMNPQDKIEIEAPSKGKEITKNDYQATIKGKMIEMRNNRGRRRN
ncbi:GLPGLI family protein [Tenacibaculum sp. HL-MS23]|uniref:GLPGLI family protein n=1 Tax=Tenacibaculum sp. HL-MS23 TaxID=3077734 RepID=UPI0028FC1DC9|nr:GLPGLI family protein [Tenacibaculum sp. HL-MS23]WNW01466.1 GLPGLI family protein [Tenacibaculum sp. HL-MS23]